ncbi:hypothetical protein BDY24DRAFT_373760 [Mrakia frigida]|uniref:uncharacterized protein n=1 Tax=Mrakia frigida TaxID=29902 RepID=UPI003FCBEEB2
MIRDSATRTSSALLVLALPLRKTTSSPSAPPRSLFPSTPTISSYSPSLLLQLPLPSISVVCRAAESGLREERGRKSRSSPKTQNLFSSLLGCVPQG